MSETQQDEWVTDTLGIDPASYAGGSPGRGDAPGGPKPGKGLLSAFADAVKSAVSTPKDEPAPLLGSAQQKRSEGKLAKLAAPDQEKYKAMLAQAKTQNEKDYLAKGLASGHSVAELATFQAKISGKSEKWLQDNLALTGNSSGKGVKQQWAMSCNATTAQAVKGQLDPLYALKLHEDNKNVNAADGDDPRKKNKALADEQKAMLEKADPDGSAGGLALPRDHDDQHQGRWNTDLLNDMKDVTGVSYANKKIGVETTLDDGIKEIDTHLDKGTPVPIVIGNKVDEYTHYVLVTKCTQKPPKVYTIHDPWSGKTYKRTAEQLSKGKLDIAGSNQVSAIEMPTEEAVK